MSSGAFDFRAPRARLLAWYDEHARDLPWRRTRDPYAIWVSEIMLQQTRVDTVIPYYQRFVSRFPDVQSLADAPLDDVLAHWSGLGYYRRARLLHQGAQAVAREHGGKVPASAQARLALPGVGRYTAGAIGSIAFGLPEPIVDGNVARVLTRLLGIDTPLGDKRTERALWEHASQIAQGERPGALNQALMELGARVCTPVRAYCESCPLAPECTARREDRVDALPVVPPKKAPKPVALVALIARARDGRLWVTQSEGTLFAGLWGCPLLEGRGREEAEALAQDMGLSGELSARSLGRVEHVLTHRKFGIDVYALNNAKGRARATLKAVTEEELAGLGVATLTRKILAVSTFCSRAQPPASTAKRKKTRG